METLFHPLVELHFGTNKDEIEHPLQYSNLFYTHVFLVSVLRPTPNHIPLKCRCPNDCYVGIRHVAIIMKIAVVGWVPQTSFPVVHSNRIHELISYMKLFYGPIFSEASNRVFVSDASIWSVSIYIYIWVNIHLLHTVSWSMISKCKWSIYCRIWHFFSINSTIN